MNYLFLTEADSGLYFVFGLKTAVSGAKNTKFSKGAPPTPQLKNFNSLRLLHIARSTYFILLFYLGSTAVDAILSSNQGRRYSSVDIFGYGMDRPDCSLYCCFEV